MPDQKGRLKQAVVPLVDDIIGDRFWKDNPEIIGLKSLEKYEPQKNTQKANKDSVKSEQQSTEEKIPDSVRCERMEN